VTVPGGVVDAHHHLWDAEAADYPWMTGPFEPLRRVYGPDDLAPRLASNNVSATVVVQARADLAETEELLDCACRTPFIAGVVGWADLTSAGLRDDVEALAGGPGGARLVGLRHGAADEDDPDWLLRADVGRGLRKLPGLGLTFDLEITVRELPAAVELVGRHPDLRFVLDHGAKPPIATGGSPDWAPGVAQLAAAPNVWGKLSGLVTEADWAHWTPSGLRRYVDTLLEAFGPSRLMFGSDWPVCELAAGYDAVLSAAAECLAGLSAGERERVFARTAIECYGLDPAARADPGATR
jgi:L-fuconolactonase